MTEQVSAQFWDFVHRTLNGDTSAAPAYDTAYIRSYRDDLVLSPVAAYQGNSIDLWRKDGGRLSFRTNTPVQVGLGLDYKWLGVEATFTLPGISGSNADHGTTKASGIGFGYTGRRWWFRNFWRYCQGFYAADPQLVDPDWQEGEPYPYRADLESRTYMASLNRGFNPRRYSYNAAIWQMERQKKSAGSWTMGATFWYWRAESSSSLIPPEELALYRAELGVRRVRRWLFSFTGGYAYTWVFGRHGFLNAMVVPGIGAQQQKLEGVNGAEAESGWALAGTLELRAGTGYVGDRWYASFTANSYQSTGEVAPEARLGSTFVNMRLALGWRFQHIKPVLPRLGL